MEDHVNHINNYVQKHPKLRPDVDKVISADCKLGIPNVIDFFESQGFVHSDSKKIPLSDLYEKYKSHLLSSSRIPLGRNDFSRTLSRIGFMKTTGRNIYFYIENIKDIISMHNHIFTMPNLQNNIKPIPLGGLNSGQINMPQINIPTVNQISPVTINYENTLVETNKSSPIDELNQSILTYQQQLFEKYKQEHEELLKYKQIAEEKDKEVEELKRIIKEHNLNVSDLINRSRTPVESR